jgi:hypothetical protein
VKIATVNGKDVGEVVYKNGKFSAYLYSGSNKTKSILGNYSSECDAMAAIHIKTVPDFKCIDPCQECGGSGEDAKENDCPACFGTGRAQRK